MSEPTSPQKALSIGLCLWNEETTIQSAITSLFQQDIFQHPHIDWFRFIEIVCLANGCRDRTADVCRQALEEQVLSRGLGDRIRWQVEEVSWSGLARALNHLTHHLTDPAAEYMVKMDADVIIVQSNTIRALIEALEADRVAQIAVPTVEKAIAAKPRRSMIDSFSLFASRVSKPSGRVPLSGALYCGRGPALRSIWQVEGPQGLDTGTDVHVRDMLVTDQFRYHPSMPWREDVVIRVPTVSVLFEAYSGLRQNAYHQKRRVISNMCRSILHQHLREVNDPRGGSEVIREMNETDPDWFRKLVESKMSTDSWWVLPRRCIEWDRLKRLRNLTWAKLLTRLPAALVMECCDCWASVSANRDMRQGKYASIWRMGR